MNKFQEALREHFIPHEGNNHQPHFLRTKLVLLLLALVFAVQGLYITSTFIALPSSKNFAAIFATVLIDQTNEKRGEEHLGTLAYNIQLEDAAKMKADDMAAKGYFAHNSPDGKTPWDWIDKAHYDFSAAGENLAVNFVDSKDVTEAWMHSPSHRANIVNPNYTEIGIATAQGVYKGRTAIFVVQMFGRPLEKNNFVAVVATSSTPQVLTAKGVAIAPVKKSLETPKITKATSVPNTALLTPTSTPPKTQVAGAEIVKENPVMPTAITATPKTTKMAAVISAPRHLVENIYIILAIVSMLALSSAFFIKIRIQHPKILLNGALLVGITTLLIYADSLLSFARGIV